MTALGDRLVILLIVATALAGMFAWWSGFIEGMFGGWAELLLRVLLVLLFVALIFVVWRKSRMTESNSES